MYMPGSQFGVAALSLARGGGSQFLQRLLLLATDHMAADGGVLVAHRDDEYDILCSVGLPLSATVEIDERQFSAYRINAGTVFEDARRNDKVKAWTFVKSAPFWQSLNIIKLDVRLPGVTVIAIFGSHQAIAPRSMREPPPFFGRLIDVLHDVFSMIAEIADLSNRQILLKDENVVAEDPALFEGQIKLQECDHNVVERFLIDTLISQPRVLSRGSVSYHAIRRWRQTIKAEQISALKAIKKMPSSQFEATIAEEMSSWCRRAFGGTAFANVVAVPCGHSGEDCLARRIGQQVGTQLGINYLDAFEPLVITGSSHPKTNVRRPKMKLATVPVGPLLLVDDVATSGSHIEEAAVALRRHGLAVTSIAWIGTG